MMAYLTLGSAFTSQQRAIVAVSDSGGAISESPIDLTARTIVGRVYDFGAVADDPADTSGALASIDETAGIDIIDAAQGIFTWSLTAAQGREIRASSWSPQQTKRQIVLRIWDTTTADNPQMLYEEMIWGF